jgi:alpha-L-fucosidase
MHTTAKPTLRQLEFQEWEFGIFLHFGIRTFYEGHRDWDGKPMSPSAFNPTQLDCHQWVTTAQEAGAKYMVLVVKHHDGFATWPSKYSKFTVAQSPWKGGKGDVVREFTDACRRHGMHSGLYYSPAEWGNPVFKDAKAYDDHFINQISEILTGYGELDVLWFDGCGSEGHTYDWARIVKEIRYMQPRILIFNMGDPDFRWVGNEAGVAPVPCWNTVEEVPFSVQTMAKDRVGGPKWLPAECDCRMRERNWFYEDADEHTVKSVVELMGLYYLSVGRGCNLLLNIGPDRRGLLPDKDAARLLEFGAEIRRRFSNPLPIKTMSQKDNAFLYQLAEPALVNHAVLQEDLTDGEYIRRFNIKAHVGGPPIVVWEGYNIGHKAICHFPPVRAQKIQLEITESSGPFRLRCAQFFAVGAHGKK